jgi:hypothetical protein
VANFSPRLASPIIVCSSPEGPTPRPVEILSKSKKLPASIDKEKFELAKATLATVTQTCTEASNAFNSGNLLDAVGKANSVKEKATEIMNVLGMKAPAAAQK